MFKNWNSKKSSARRWIFVQRLTLSSVQLQNLCKAESGPKQPSTILPSAGLLVFSWKCTRVEMVAGVLIFWFLNSVLACLLHSLCFVNFVVGISPDMLIYRENLPAVAQGETISKPRRLIRMFLQVHITANECRPAFCCVPVTSSLMPFVTTCYLLKLFKASI